MQLTRLLALASLVFVSTSAMAVPEADAEAEPLALDLEEHAAAACKCAKGTPQGQYCGYCNNPNRVISCVSGGCVNDVCLSSHTVVRAQY